MADERLCRKENMSIENELPRQHGASSQQASLFVVMPNTRQKGWAVCYDQIVFFVKDSQGKFRARTGHICSTPHSHVGVDNVSKVVVWSDVALRDCDCADDSHERSFAVSDPLLIKLEEVQHILEGRKLKEWFGGSLSPREIIQIHRLLKRSDFGRSCELAEIAERERPLRMMQQLHSTWWQRFKCPIPLQPKPSRFWGQ